MLAVLFAAVLTNLTGIVTLEREGLDFVFMSDGRGVHWRVEMAGGGKPAVRIGDVVAVRGETESSIKHRVRAASVEVLRFAPDELPPPRSSSIAEIFREVMPYGQTSWYGEVIVAEGIVRDINRRQTSTQLLVGEGNFNLQVEVPLALEDALPAQLVQGATVRVTGNLAYTSIENFEEGIFGRAENVELIPASINAVEVVRRAPFFTAERLLMILGGIGAITLAILAWAFMLRRMVARRTCELAESIRERETERIEADAARRERLRLAADLHDGFQQYLAGAMFRLKAAINYLPETAGKSRGQLAKVQEALQHTQNGLRSTLWAMNEESEGPESLLDLFRFTARRMGHWEGIVSIDSSGEERKVARKSAGTLLLIMQEAVGNALKHGKASHVRVRMEFREEKLVMSIVDDGIGFPKELRPEPDGRGALTLDGAALNKAGHYGMASMERRARELGGEMSVWSKMRIGAKIVFSIPYSL